MRIQLICLVVVCAIFRSAHAQTIEQTGKFGSFSMGEAAGTYPDNVDRTWRITVREGYKVSIWFTNFELEDSYDDELGGSCVYDFVQLDGDRKFCGKSNDAPRGRYYSKGNVMTIRFVSDYSNEDPLPRGFDAHWVEEDVDECYDISQAVARGGEDWDEILYCNHFCNNVPGTYYCSCRPGFVLDANQHTCVAICVDQVIAEPDGGGFIASSDYPKPYSKLADCLTSLQAPPGIRINIRFDPVFGIEEHYEEGCVYDWLEVTGDDDNTMRYCGETAPHNGSLIELDTNRVRLYFRSDLALEETGYKMYYETYRVKCREVLEVPANGDVAMAPTKDVFEYEDRIVFACDRGYRLVGSRETVCTADGTWSQPVPTCQIKHCPRPDHLLNIPRTNPPEFEEEERPYGSTIIVECVDQWYELVSGTAVWTCEDDETWHEGARPVIPNANNNYPVCRPYCGVKNAREELDFFASQILGGRNARDGEWPWMAFVYLGVETGLSALRSEVDFCGGSLVDEQYVVTAAHCVDGLTASSIQVWLGVTDRNNDSNPHRQAFRVSELHIHTDYVNPPNARALFDADIAVLKLDRKAAIGRYVRPICIPRTPFQQSLPRDHPQRGVVAGWGITELGRPSPILKLVRVPYVNNTACVAAYNEQSSEHPSYHHITVTENHFCAGFINKAKDSCDGDSGGPLMWRDDRRWFLNGIVSFGTSLEECEFYVLGVYTKVANYIRFLDNNIILPP